MRLHSGHLPFKCETCGANFNSSSHWKLHKQMHLKHAQRAVLASLQGYNAKDDMLSDKNQLTVDASRERTYPSVQKLDVNMSLLRPKATSVKSVEILPPLKTLPGPNTVLSTDELKRLILTNISTDGSVAPGATQLRFKCDQCLQRFKFKSGLTKHLRTHTGERPYKCPLCPRTFADASNFKRHKKLHKTATEELENATKKYKSADFLHEFQRDRRKLLPVGSASPTPSIASDPDPDGLEALQLSIVSSPKSASYISDDNDTVFDMLDSIAGQTNRRISGGNDTSHNTNALNVLHKSAIPKSPQRLICISYPNPANPNDNKMTTFYV